MSDDSPFTRSGSFNRTRSAAAVEKRPLSAEPPPDKYCEHIFNLATVAIAAEQVNIEAKDVVSVLPQALAKSIISAAR